MFPSFARADGWTLDRARARALEVSADLRAARARLDQARGRKTTASALLPNPDIETGLRTDRPFAAEGESSFDISLRQELPIFGQRGLRLSAAGADVAAAELGVDAENRLVLARTTVAFYELLYQERRAEAVRAVATQAEALSVAAARRHAVGDISAAEEALTRADRVSARADSDEAGADLEEARARLAALLSTTPDIQASGDFPTLPPSAPAVDLVIRATSTRPDLRAAALAVRARGYDLARARREQIPVPSLSVGVSRERSIFAAADGRPALDDTDWLIGADLSIPLPLFQRGSGAVMEADGRRAEVQAQRDTLERSATEAVRVAHARYESARRRVADSADVESVLGDTLLLYERAYAAGKLDLAAYLAARDRILRARLVSLRARRDGAAAAAELEIAVGGPFTQVTR